MNCTRCGARIIEPHVGNNVRFIVTKEVETKSIRNAHLILDEGVLCSECTTRFCDIVYKQME